MGFINVGFLFYLCFIVQNVKCTLKENYYQTLIEQEVKTALKYEFPKNNKEFEKGFESTTVNDFGSYDFVIIGAGSAGSVVATRLSEINNYSILLIEAGDEETDFSKIPGMFQYVINSNIGWGYYTVSQNNTCLGMKNRQCFIPRGKVLGGTSSINGMVYSRGFPEDYEVWSNLKNPGWSYKNVLPYFIKSENSQIETNSKSHGKQGFWNIENIEVDKDFINFNEILFKASKEVNLSLIDYNDAQIQGVGRIQANTKRGVRQSLNTAFLSNARKRKNLKIVTKAFVTKIIINPDSKVAEGVEFVHQDKKFKVKATKEVVLSAGAYNSPQILMLSGIGPRQHLEDLGIKVIKDLPVGQNLLDHPVFGGIILRTNIEFATQTLQELIPKYFKGRGTLSFSDGIDFLGFIDPEQKFPKRAALEILLLKDDKDLPPTFTKITNLDDNIVKKFTKSLNLKTDILVLLILLHGNTKGQVTLKSSSPLDFPDIDYDFGKNKDDVETILKGIRFIQKLIKTDAMKAIDAQIVKINFCLEFEADSDDYWKCAIRHFSTTNLHPSGSTAMGPDDNTSVVDKDLRVHGINNLRVVDAGIIPITITGHLNAPVVMVAEKFSDIIKKEYHN